MPINITVELVQELMEQNVALLKQNEELTATIKELTQTIKELEEKLNKNSRNSSKSPSTDGLKKPNRNTKPKRRYPAAFEPKKEYRIISCPMLEQ